MQGRPVYPEPAQVAPVQPEMPRQVWHDAEPPGQIWHEPEPDQGWQLPVQAPPQMLRLTPGHGYEAADGPWPDQPGAAGSQRGRPHDQPAGYQPDLSSGYRQAPPEYGPANGGFPDDGFRAGYGPPGAGPVEQYPTAYQSGYGPPAGYVPGRPGGPAGPDTFAAAEPQPRRDGYAAPGQADSHAAGQHDAPGGFPQADPAAGEHYGQGDGAAGGYGQAGGYGRTGGYGPGQGYAPDDSLGPPHGMRGGPGADAGYGPNSGYAAPGRPDVRGQSAGAGRRGGRFSPRGPVGPGGAGRPAGPGGPGAHPGDVPHGGYGPAPGPDNGFGPHGGFGYETPGPNGEFGQGRGFGPPAQMGREGTRSRDDGSWRRDDGRGRPDGSRGPGGFGPADGYDVPARYGPHDGLGAPHGYGPPGGYGAPDGYRAPDGYGVPGQGPRDGYGSGGAAQNTRRPAGNQVPGGGSADPGGRAPGAQLPRRRPGATGQGGPAQPQRPGPEASSRPEGPGQAAGYRRGAANGPVWPSRNGAPEGFSHGPRNPAGYGHDGQSAGPRRGQSVPDQYGRQDYYPPDARNRPPRRSDVPPGYWSEASQRDRWQRGQQMPADPRWQDQAGRAWDGQDPRYGGHDMRGADRAGGPWLDDGGFGYQPGGPPPPRAYGFHGRDGYAAGYQDHRRGYEAAGPAVSDQQEVRPPHAAVAGDGQAGRSADGRPAGRQAGQPRKAGPPAALPPGPSASGARASGQETDAAGRDMAAGREAAAAEPGGPAEQGKQAKVPTIAARPEPSAHTAAQAGPDRAASDGASAQPVATPPSPTGTPPPAVTEVASPGPPVADSEPGQDGYEIVSPDAETTPMAVILGDQPLKTQRPAEPAAAAVPPRRAGSVPPPSQPPVQRVRGPFEPPAKSDPVENAAPPPVSAPDPGPAASAAATTMSQAARASIWSPATAKMDQIKDLYLTAEAIGEDALDKNFELVSDRQRQLIREYFDQTVATGAESSDAAS